MQKLLIRWRLREPAHKAQHKITRAYTKNIDRKMEAQVTVAETTVAEEFWNTFIRCYEYPLAVGT